LAGVRRTLGGNLAQWKGNVRTAAGVDCREPV